MKLLAVSWGGEAPEPVLRMAATLSREMGAELHVAHVWNSPLPGAPEFVESNHYKRQEEDARRLIGTAVETVESAAGVTVTETHMRVGHPDSEVIGLSSEVGADMVIVGKQRCGFIKRLLVGSESERIARHAPCPVLLVGEENAESRSTYRR